MKKIIAIILCGLTLFLLSNQCQAKFIAPTASVWEVYNVIECSSSVTLKTFRNNSEKGVKVFGYFLDRHIFQVKVTSKYDRAPASVLVRGEWIHKVYIRKDRVVSTFLWLVKYANLVTELDATSCKVHGID